eukprot:1141341-Pelagomonas_calceolata.AAC.3
MVAYSKQCHIRAQRAFAKGANREKIAKHPALANKDILNGKSTPPPQAQALTDPTTGEVETDPCKVAGIVEKFFTGCMAAPNIKTGVYLPSDPCAKRNYTWMELSARITSSLKLPSPGPIILPKRRENGFMTRLVKV